MPISGVDSYEFLWAIIYVDVTRVLTFFTNLSYRI